MKYLQTFGGGKGGKTANTGGGRNPASIFARAAKINGGAVGANPSGRGGRGVRAPTRARSLGRAGKKAKPLSLVVRRARNIQRAGQKANAAKAG